MNHSPVDEAAVPAAVLGAFGITADAVSLDGGQGQSHRAGSIVLKPDADPVETPWAAELLSRIAPDGVRVPRPVPTIEGGWVAEGWSASTYVEGEAEPEGRWVELLAAGARFHDAMAREPEPAFLAERRHRWAVGDRVAWGEAEVALVPEIAPALDRLRSLQRPVSLPSQLIHGDLSGNVLFAPGLPPAVIDFSPYWRPVAYAAAVVVVDALMWWEADAALIDECRTSEHWEQLLVRALVFRLVSLNEHARDVDPTCLEQLPAMLPVVDLLEGLVRP